MMEKNLLLSDWVEQYTDEMCAWAFHKTSSSELARDLVQDTFLAAHEKFDGFRGQSTPKTWLYSILNHKIIDHYRKKVRQPVDTGDEIFEGVFDAEGSWQTNHIPRNWHTEEGHLLDDEDFQRVLQKCLEALPDSWNTCVRLKYLLQKSGQEICQELNIAPTNYWQIIHRAKLQLRECIEHNWFVT